MEVTDALVEIAKIFGPIAVAYIGVLKNRTDLDKYAASQRSKESGRPPEMEMRRRWYQKVFRKRYNSPVPQIEKGKDQL